jgi:RNA methyltransferase, TrmH family
LFPVITSSANDKLKLIRKLHQKKHRDAHGLFVAEGEDVVAGGDVLDELFMLVAGVDVERELLDQVSTLGSGTEVIGVYRQAWSEPGGDVSVYLEGVRDPGNVGTIIRLAHAFADGPVVLGPGCADPYSPKAVRATMGSIFARPPARARLADLGGTKIALERSGGRALADVEGKAPVVLCLGAEREGLSQEALELADEVAHIPMRPDGPDSLNVATAAAVALYEANRMARRG